MDYSTVDDALYCKDIHCNIVSHKEHINAYCNKLIDILIHAGNMCFPHKRKGLLTSERQFQVPASEYYSRALELIEPMDRSLKWTDC